MESPPSLFQLLNVEKSNDWLMEWRKFWLQKSVTSVDLQDVGCDWTMLGEVVMSTVPGLGMCGSLNWKLNFNYFPWIELNWLNCCELKVSIQFIYIIVGNKTVKYHKFLCFQIWLNLDDVKLVFAIQKLNILNQKVPQKTTAGIVKVYMSIKWRFSTWLFFEISRRRALNWFWIELQFMPSNWIGIELNKNCLNRTWLTRTSEATMKTLIPMKLFLCIMKYINLETLQFIIFVNKFYNRCESKEPKNVWIQYSWRKKPYSLGFSNKCYYWDMKILLTESFL